MAETTYHFDALTSLDRDTFLSLLELASRLKTEPHADRLSGLTMALLFQKPSLRTRMSFELAMHALGGHALTMSPVEVGMGKRESVADVARVVSRYVDVIVARTFGHDIFSELAAYATVPCINALTDYNHPAQIFCDLLTIKEHLGRVERFHLAYVGDGNNVANSWLNAACRLDFDLTIAVPESFDPDADTLQRAKKEAAGEIRLVRDVATAAAGADVLYTDVWTSMGQEEERERRLNAFQGFCLTPQVLARANQKAIVMHCLPAHRGEEIADEVMEGAQSVVFDQAENRLHGQKALILYALGRG